MADRFAHHRLDVYELALELAVLAKGVSEEIPRGYRTLSDQLLRSGSGVVLLIAEGANRRSAAQKRQRFVEARGECGEAAATVELSQRLGLISREDCRLFSEHRPENRGHAQRSHPQARLTLPRRALGPATSSPSPFHAFTHHLSPARAPAR